MPGDSACQKLPPLRTQRQTAIMRSVFAKTTAETIWQETSDGALVLTGGVDLVRALAWFLTFDAFEGPYTLKGEIDERQVRELRAKVIVNDARWLPFARWANYLGFALLSGNRLAVDPTRAVSTLLVAHSQEKGGKGKWISADQFLALVATELPVLDGGRFRESVLERQGSRTDSDGRLSSAMTVAILVLKELDAIEIEEGTGDAKKALFARDLGAVHRLRWKGGWPK